MTFIHVSGKEITDIPHVQHGIRREWNMQAGAHILTFERADHRSAGICRACRQYLTFT